MPNLSIEQLRELAQRALMRSGADATMASTTADALVYAEARGLASHGMTRVSQYAAHLRNGRADGNARPRIVASRGGAALISAGSGLAYPACALAVKEAIARAREFGVSLVSVTDSHHYGVAAFHLTAVGSAGMVGLAFSNSPAAMPVAGGKRPLLGTNPIAAVFPRMHQAPLLIDMSLSEVARGKLMMAAKAGKPIPLGWALDAQGLPTTDARAGLDGSMLAMGGIKGAMLALVVELLVTTLTGASLGFEASSFFVDDGNRPRLGHAFLVVDPGALGGPSIYGERIETLVTAMMDEEGVRLPGERREVLAQAARADGVEISPQLHEQLIELAR